MTPTVMVLANNNNKPLHLSLTECLPARAVCWLIFTPSLRVTINLQKSKLRQNGVKQISQDNTRIIAGVQTPACFTQGACSELTTPHSALHKAINI